MDNKILAIDLDGTLAEQPKRRDNRVVGEPIPKMVKRVKNWLASGHKVYIFTSRKTRLDYDDIEEEIIRQWCKVNIGQELPITATKMYTFDVFYDDKAIKVKRNKGELVI